jgi:hypothetical protein
MPSKVGIPPMTTRSFVTFRELARTRTQRRESDLSPPNGFSVALSLNSAGRLISEASLSILL